MNAPPTLFDVLGFATNDVPGLMTFAHACAEQEELELALTAATWATRLAPRDAQAWCLMAALHIRRDETLAARHAYEQAALLAPSDVRVVCDLAETQLALLDHTAAALSLSRALDIDREGATPAGRRARLLIARAYAIAARAL